MQRPWVCCCPPQVASLRSSGYTTIARIMYGVPGTPLILRPTRGYTGASQDYQTRNTHAAQGTEPIEPQASWGRNSPLIFHLKILTSSDDVHITSFKKVLRLKPALSEPMSIVSIYYTRLMTKLAFCPPNAKLLERACTISLTASLYGV